MGTVCIQLFSNPLKKTFKMKPFCVLMALMGASHAAPQLAFDSYAPSRADIAQLLKSTRELVDQANAIPGLSVVRTGEPTPLGILETTDIGLADNLSTPRGINVVPNSPLPSGYPFTVSLPDSEQERTALLKSADALVKTINQIPGLKVIRNGEPTPLGLLEQSDIALDRKRRQVAFATPYAQTAFAAPFAYATAPVAAAVPAAPIAAALPAGFDSLLTSTKDLIAQVNGIPGLKVVRTGEPTPTGILETTDLAIDTRPPPSSAPSTPGPSPSPPPRRLRRLSWPLPTLSSRLPTPSPESRLSGLASPLPSVSWRRAKSLSNKE